MPESIPEKPLSQREEEVLLNAARRVLLSGGFPNPERVGCPGSEILRAIAFRKMELAQAEDYIDHMGCCSPCFSEYTAFREQVEKIVSLRLLAVAAGVLIVIGIGSWVWVKNHGRKAFEPPMAYQAVIVDLRDRVVLRGPEEGPPQGPLELPRAALALSIYLPVGSEPGQYQVEMEREAGKALAKAEGSAVLRNHIAVLQVKLNLAPFQPGVYRLGIRRTRWGWTYYPVAVK